MSYNYNEYLYSTLVKYSNSKITRNAACRKPVDSVFSDESMHTEKSCNARVLRSLSW